MKHRNQKNKSNRARPARNRGFTLIEMIVYMALFSIMMGGLIVTVHQLYQSIGSMNSKVMEQEEINFVIKKIDWVLTGVSSINAPLSGTSPTLNINKTGFIQNPIIIKFNSVRKDIEIQTGASNPFFPLTTKNVKVTSLQFQYLPAVGTAPAGITATIIINGTVATITKYLRI